MRNATRSRRSAPGRLCSIALIVLALIGSTSSLSAQEKTIDERLAGFDAYMAKALEDWNAPGLGVGIVVDGKLVFAKGYGYRDYGKKLPFTPKTLCPIASNTKLFTSVAAGLLVEGGQLAWDEPVRDLVPAIRFSTEELNNRVTVRDMLSHRTGITRHDMIWYKSDFTRKELFERIKYMEPREPMRKLFLYNNMMYVGVGYAIELQSGKTWEDFVRARIFEPLAMNSTVYTVSEMLEADDHGVPYTERRESTELYQIPYYEDTQGLAPAGAIISNIEDLSHWLIALMNEGKYEGRQVLPPGALKATLEPAIAQTNTLAEARGFWEILNPVYGMGRSSSSYRGHLLTLHGGDLPGFHSQVSFMPRDGIGVIVFVIGDHCAGLYNIVSFNVYERLLGLDQTPWSDRWLEVRRKGKEAGKQARAKAGAQQVKKTRPSHPVADYAGDYVHPAYGVLRIAHEKGKLQFDFHKIRLPLAHFHYDRFDTPDDELDGKWSVNFRTNPEGDVDQAVMSLDESEVVFTRAPETLDRKTLEQLAGTYETPTSAKFRVVLKEDNGLYLVLAGQPEIRLVPYKGLKFHVEEFSDQVYEFVMDNGATTALKTIDPSGEYISMRK
jgi:CubicO group peptidase (beta-lactamase class C family)